MLLLFAVKLKMLELILQTLYLLIPQPKHIQNFIKKYSKPKWLTFLADSKTHLDKFWKKYFEDLPDGQLVADVKATVKHCKEMTAAALSL